MSDTKPLRANMRIIHRYLGFFLAGIMAVYSVSGIIMIFRDTDFLKQEKHISKQVKLNAEPGELGPLLRMREVKVKKQEGNLLIFDNGTYDKSTGQPDRLNIPSKSFLICSIK